MRAHIITTTYENSIIETITETPAFFSDASHRELYLVNLYPEIKYQTIDGFGGAITESVGVVLQALPNALADKIIESYFGQEGIGYTLVRTHLDSCDFSTENYSAVESADDPHLNTFSLVHDEKNIIPYIQSASKAAGKDIDVMLSPWSPPAFMKTNADKNGGGKLKPEYYALWAKYICKYILAYRAKGINVTMFSVQNEPKAVQTWDSCVFSAEEEHDFLQKFLYPELLKNGLQDMGVYIWDHNKERLYDRAKAVIDSFTSTIIEGVAFHWYSGDHFDAVRLVREQFPDKKLLFSEGCIEYSHLDKTQQLQHAQMYAHDMIGNLNVGLNTFIDWNIVLDIQGGPNHVQNFCEAPIMCDTVNYSIEKKLSFYYIMHFSKYIKPQARHIATTCYSPKLEVTAFENPDKSIVVIMLNRTSEDQPAFIRLYGELLNITGRKESISTLIIDKSE
ncbi:MAG: glycoside hydrolase family 30 beta sandwich domain-containing protein [Acetanaerobacterium sp.]